MGTLTAHKFLTDAAIIEKKAGELYSALADRFEDDPDTSALFERLSEEEYVHERALMMLERIARGIKEEVRIDPKFEDLCRTLGDQLDRAIAMLAAGRPITVESALNLALRVESTLIEEQSSEIIETDSPEFQRTLKVLRVQTTQHKERLVEFMEKRKKEGISGQK